MDKEIYNKQIESLKQEKLRENNRHDNKISDLAKQKQAEIDRHNKAIQNINSRIEQLKNNKKRISNEEYIEKTDIKRLIYELSELINNK